jgi:hypothetical protein
MAMTDQMRRHIRRVQEDLNANISEVERKVRSTVDWRAQFDERPITVIGLAFGAGVLLSALLPVRKGNSRRLVPAADASGSNEALAVVETDRLVGLDGLVPGFEQEFAKARLNNRNYRSERTYDPSQPSWQEYSSIDGD